MNNVLRDLLQYLHKNNMPIDHGYLDHNVHFLSSFFRKNQRMKYKCHKVSRPHYWLLINLLNMSIFVAVKNRNNDFVLTATEFCDLSMEIH